MTPARRRALQWFKDHEEEPLAVLMKDRPSTKMCRLMAREKQVVRLPVGQFGFDKWVLTFAGREALALASNRRGKCTTDATTRSRLPGVQC